MNRRRWILALVGAVLVGTVALSLELHLDRGGCSGPSAFVDEGFCSAPRIELLWFKLSEKQTLAWSIAIGASAGIVLGVIVDQSAPQRRSANVPPSSATP
jgi:hypothetical protein